MRTSRPGNGPDGRQKGFSLLEIFIVLVIMALVAVLVAPSFTRGFQGLQLETAGRDLVTILKQARSAAISKQQVCRVVLTRDQASTPIYALTNDYGEIVKEYPLPNGITFLVEDDRQLPITVSFYPNGRSSGGKVVLVGSQGRHMPIVVDPVTGFGRVISESAENEGR